MGYGPGQPTHAPSTSRHRVGDVLLIEEFTAADLPRIRLAAYHQILRSGLIETRALMFAFAVDVGLVNAVQHGGGEGVLRLLYDARHRLVGEVLDRGGGFSPPVGDGTIPATAGRGLWLAQRLVDELDLRSGPRGTTLRLVVAIAGTHYPWAGSRYDARLAELIAEVLFPKRRPA